MGYGLKGLCKLIAQKNSVLGYCVSTLSLLTIISSFMLAGCGSQPDNSSSLKHELDNPTRDTNPWNWHALTDREFKKVFTPYYSEYEFVAADSPVTKRVDFWIEKIDSKMRELYPEKLKNIPTPKAVVFDVPLPNAQAMTIPKCYDVSVLVDSKADRDARADAKGAALVIPKSQITVPPSSGLSVMGLQLSNSLHCVKAKESDEQTIRQIVEAFNDNTTPCMVTLEKDSSGKLIVVVSDMCKKSGELAKIKKAEKLVVPVTVDRIGVMAGLFSIFPMESLFVEVIAHELAHYYKSHMTMAFQKNDYNFFYKIDSDRNYAFRPTPDSESQSLGKEVLAVSLPYTKYQRIPNQRFRSELFPSIIKMLGLINTDQKRLIAQKNASEDVIASTMRLTSDPQYQLNNDEIKSLQGCSDEQGCSGNTAKEDSAEINDSTSCPVELATANEGCEAAEKNADSGKEDCDEEICIKSCNLAFEWLSELDNLKYLIAMPKLLLSERENTINKYLEAEKLFESCLKDASVDLDGSKQGKGLVPFMIMSTLMVDTDIAKAFVDVKFEGTLLDVVEDAEKALVKYYSEIQVPLDKAAEYKLGYYTYEQEADELAVEIMSKLGFNPELAVISNLFLAQVQGAMLEVFGREESPYTVKSNTCMELYAKGWKDDEGNPVFIPIGDYDDPHHSTCFRAYNMSREIEAHKYSEIDTHGFNDYPEDYEWAQIQQQAMSKYLSKMQVVEL